MRRRRARRKISTDFYEGKELTVITLLTYLFIALNGRWRRPYSNNTNSFNCTYEGKNKGHINALFHPGTLLCPSNACQ
jgi:hypothetical protein